MKSFKNGLLTGLTLQLAIGPVFFYITNLALQKSFLDGIAGVLGVTTVDYFYITLSILGIGKLLENKNFKKVFGIISSVVLIIFGLLILKGLLENSSTDSSLTNTSNIISSYTSVFLITISSPMTIVFFTSLFTAKVVEYKYTKKELAFFGIGTGLATFIFMGSAVILFSLIRGTVPTLLIQILNGFVGLILIAYGIKRLYKNLQSKI
jgi:threonine/homoserine/homoserine lactone efflux protein